MDGRVLHVNVSPGGVPKLPVERAWVGELGLDGDRHRHDTVHGGPHRAVALLGIEAIERVQAEGHQIRVLPPADAEAAARHLLLERIDAVILDFEVGLWRIAAEAGCDIRIEDSGELAMAASSELPSSTFNRALGHRILPHLIDRM